MAASFFLRGENISEDLHKLCEAADNQAAIPEDVDVWYPFENEDAETLERYIFDLKQMLIEVKDRTIFQLRFGEGMDDFIKIKKINHE
jgi:hypothetical protein